jgi:Adenylate and Guanylate cyclase catalytic domain
MCIALLDISDPYDIHIQVALSILGNLEKHNSTPELRESRKFDVRIGISQNEDTLVKDITRRRNIAGAGVNTAQRVMDKGDGGHILVSQTVYDHLQHHERYMELFEDFTTTTKHGERVNVYQLVDGMIHGLNCETPSAFRVEETDSRLTRLVAYYLAHAMVHREILLEYKDPTDMYGGVILLYFKASDSVELHEAEEFTDPIFKTYGAENSTPFSKQYAHYANLEMFVKSVLHTLIIKVYLSKYSTCFARRHVTSRDYRFVSPHGQEKLKEEWPEIWEECSLDKYVTN